MKSPYPDVGIYRCIRAVESIIDADNAPPSEPPFPMRVLKIIPVQWGDAVGGEWSSLFAGIIFNTRKVEECTVVV